MSLPPTNSSSDTDRAPAASPSDHDLEIVSQRRFNTARAAVFRAFSEPERLATWWGPNGFTNEFESFDFQPGGRWRFVMRAPDGTRYPNESEFITVEPPQTIVFQHLEPVHGFRMTITFDESQSGATLLTWRMRFATVAECARVRTFISAANEQNFDRLAAHLAAHP